MLKTGVNLEDVIIPLSPFSLWLSFGWKREEEGWSYLVFSVFKTMLCVYLYIRIHLTRSFFSELLYLPLVLASSLWRWMICPLTVVEVRLAGEVRPAGHRRTRYSTTTTRWKEKQTFFFILSMMKPNPDSSSSSLSNLISKYQINWVLIFISLGWRYLIWLK